MCACIYQSYDIFRCNWDLKWMNRQLVSLGGAWKSASSSKAIYEMSINNWVLLLYIVLPGQRDPRSQSPPVGQRYEVRWTGLMVLSAQTAASNTITAVTLLSSRTRGIPGWQQLCTHWSASEWLTSRVKAVQLSSLAIISNLHKHMLPHSAYPHTFPLKHLSLSHLSYFCTATMMGG